MHVEKKLHIFFIHLVTFKCCIYEHKQLYKLKI